MERNDHANELRSVASLENIRTYVTDGLAWPAKLLKTVYLNRNHNRKFASAEKDDLANRKVTFRLVSQSVYKRSFPEIHDKDGQGYSSHTY